MAASSRHLTELLGGSASVNAGLASATGTANNASVITEPHQVFPSTATATGTAYNLTSSVSTHAGLATATGAALDVIVNLVVTDTDGGAGHESEFVRVLVTDSDSGSGVDDEVRAGDSKSSSDSGTATETETVFISVPAPGTPGGARTPRWIFVDGTDQYSFVINPSSTTEIVRSKNLLYQNTLGPLAQTVAFEVQDNAKTFSWSGTTLTQEQYETLIEWFDKRNEFELLDDLGRVYTIYVTDFQPKRVRSVQYPWLHTYEMKALVLSES